MRGCGWCRWIVWGRDARFRPYEMKTQGCDPIGRITGYIMIRLIIIWGY